MHFQQLRAFTFRLIREIVIVASAGAILYFGIQHFGVQQFSRAAANTPRTLSEEIEKRSPSIDLVATVANKPLTNAPLTLILAVSETCGYCVRSAPFYRELVKAVSSENTALLVAVPSITKAQAFLAAANLQNTTATTWAQLNFDVAATPLLLAINQTGTIKRIWTGALSGPREREVLSLLETPSKISEMRRTLSTGEDNLTAKEMEARTGASTLILDVRERNEYSNGHYKTAVNIPYRELAPRIAFDIGPDRDVVVDCSVVSNSAICRSAVEILVSQGIKRVSAMNANLIELNACKSTPQRN